MNGTPLAHLLAHLDPDTVLFGMFSGTPQNSATVYALRQGVVYLHRATSSGHGLMVPQVNERAAWVRLAQVCAFTAPANPQSMCLGAAGERLGAFWRDLPDARAEQRVTVPELLHAARLPALAPTA